MSVQGLWPRIKAVYASAAHQGAAASIAHDVVVRHDRSLGASFVMRIATKLKEKPKRVEEIVQTATPAMMPPNPFLPYDERLWVAHLSDTHTLLLNKYNLMDYHTLVVTRKFEDQFDPLNEADLGAVQAVLQVYPAGALAFFNHGPLSGASQRHKHLQVVPLPLGGERDESMPAVPIEPALDGGNITSSTNDDTALCLRHLPFQAYSCTFDLGCQPAYLLLQYQSLLRLANLPLDCGNAESYNWLLWCEPQRRARMLLIPRTAESFMGTSTNSLGYAGTFFLRSRHEINMISQCEPVKVLSGLGKPW